MTAPLTKQQFIFKKSNITDYYTFEGDKLGAGTYGVVRKAIHKITKQKRAVKIITKASIKNIDKFMIEVDILRKVDHPNIVRFYEWCEDDKNYYLVMELCTGGELFDRIVGVGHFSEKMAANIMHQVLSSLSYCHHMKICHRDLKPENFIYENSSQESSLKLIDFGLSKIFEDPKLGLIKMATRAGTV